MKYFTHRCLPSECLFSRNHIKKQELVTLYALRCGCHWLRCHISGNVDTELYDFASVAVQTAYR